MNVWPRWIIPGPSLCLRFAWRMTKRQTGEVKRRDTDVIAVKPWSRGTIGGNEQWTISRGQKMVLSSGDAFGWKSKSHAWKSILIMTANTTIVKNCITQQLFAYGGSGPTHWASSQSAPRHSQLPQNSRGVEDFICQFLGWCPEFKNLSLNRQFKAKHCNLILLCWARWLLFFCPTAYFRGLG